MKLEELSLRLSDHQQEKPSLKYREQHELSKLPNGHGTQRPLLPPVRHCDSSGGFTDASADGGARAGGTSIKRQGLDDPFGLAAFMRDGRVCLSA